VPEELDQQTANALELAPKPYSSSIASAWEVVEAMERRGYFWIVRDTGVVFWKLDGRKPVQVLRHGASNAPETICRAAIAAVRGEGEEAPSSG